MGHNFLFLLLLKNLLFTTIIHRWNLWRSKPHIDTWPPHPHIRKLSTRQKTRDKKKKKKKYNIGDPKKSDMRSLPLLSGYSVIIRVYRIKFKVHYRFAFQFYFLFIILLKLKEHLQTQQAMSSLLTASSSD